VAEAHAISSPMLSTYKLSKQGADLFSDPTVRPTYILTLYFKDCPQSLMGLRADP